MCGNYHSIHDFFLSIWQVDWGSTELCYSPIIQSKSTASGYDLKSTAESSPDMIAHSGVFLISTGIRYKGYCANMGRTIIVAPTKVNPLADSDDAR